MHFSAVIPLRDERSEHGDAVTVGRVCPRDRWHRHEVVAEVHEGVDSRPTGEVVLTFAFETLHESVRESRTKRQRMRLAKTRSI